MGVGVGPGEVVVGVLFLDALAEGGALVELGEEGVEVEAEAGPEVVVGAVLDGVVGEVDLVDELADLLLAEGLDEVALELDDAEALQQVNLLDVGDPVVGQVQHLEPLHVGYVLDPLDAVMAEDEFLEVRLRVQPLNLWDAVVGEVQLLEVL